MRIFKYSSLPFPFHPNGNWVKGDKSWLSGAVVCLCFSLLICLPPVLASLTMQFVGSGPWMWTHPLLSHWLLPRRPFIEVPEVLSWPQSSYTHAITSNARLWGSTSSALWVLSWLASWVFLTPKWVLVYHSASFGLETLQPLLFCYFPSLWPKGHWQGAQRSSRCSSTLEFPILQTSCIFYTSLHLQDPAGRGKAESALGIYTRSALTFLSMRGLRVLKGIPKKK